MVAMATSRNEKLVRLFFHETTEAGTWICICGTRRQKKLGWSNLLSHIHAQHGHVVTKSFCEKELQNETESPVSPFSTKSIWLNTWLEIVCLRLQPFSIIDDDILLRSVKVEKISMKTLMKYMSKLTKRVENHIARILPSKFAIVLDGWSHLDTHYIAIFATFQCKENNDMLPYSNVLLALSPLLDETTLSATSHQETIKYILSVYNKTWENVVALTGDNVSTNKALAGLVSLPLIGCASHRFQLAIQDKLSEHSEKIENIHKIMVKLRSLKNAAKLREHTDLKPILSNVTRWGSTFRMLRRYAELRPVLQTINISEVTELFPSNSEHVQLLDLISALGDLESVSKKLQENQTNMADVRALFDAVIDKFPDFKSRLGPNAPIVYDKHFESAVIKLQEKRTFDLSEDERKSVRHLLISKDDLQNRTKTISFADQIVKKRRMEISGEGVGYMQTLFLLPTSNIVERLFSKAGWALSDRRSRLSPEHFEQQIFLFLNSKYWNQTDINSILVEPVE